ncbi:hypothetical protein HYPSUDRAFT_308108 [Hypholoma sublateritium FD-334 SS-4]|uniref:Uncharacterized protein n=1 Tax=Hypholoma sublateritium (strain FD-334 SS-4) TaxID=945553 RepID=A0A0D2P5Q8_HYPSF|nr:hypothetical protein HYPSUDRAFT_308108 [Hypholoma sublateritium FD-334 SS-4]
MFFVFVRRRPPSTAPFPISICYRMIIYRMPSIMSYRSALFPPPAHADCFCPLASDALSRTRQSEVAGHLHHASVTYIHALISIWCQHPSTVPPPYHATAYVHRPDLCLFKLPYRSNLAGRAQWGPSEPRRVCVCIYATYIHTSSGACQHSWGQCHSISSAMRPHHTCSGHPLAAPASRSGADVCLYLN